MTPYPKIGWTVFANVKIHPNKSLQHTQRLDEKLQNGLFHPKENCFRALFLSSRNVCSFSLAQSKNSANSGDGLKDLVISISSKIYKPCRVLTLERTTYSQFLKRPPVGQDEIITTSLLIPCNLCPVVASFEFIGSCVILHLNSCSTAMQWGFARTVT